MKKRGKLYAIALASGLALAIQAAPASAALPGGGTYTTSISPGAISAGARTTYTVTITNNSPLASLIGFNNATVTIPVRFKSISVGTPSPPWTTAYDPTTRTVSVTSGLLLPGDSVSIPITATAPLVTGVYVWPTSASSTLGGQAQLSGPPDTVIVAKQASVVPCPANQSCDSGPLSVPATSKYLATTAEVVAQPGPQADVLTTLLPDPTTNSMLCQPPGDGAIVSWTIPTRATELTYTIQGTTYFDVYDTCFGSTQEFAQADGTNAPFNPRNHEFEGTIPFCNPSSGGGGSAAAVLSTNPPPCVVSATPGENSMTIVIDAPVGDPKYSGI